MDSLYRFFRHDDAKTEEEPMWSISSTRFESQSRLYRILYKHDISNISIDIECIIPNVDYDIEIKPFFDMLVKCLQREDISQDFRSACKLLFLEDPWIHEFRENHPSIDA